VQAKRDGGAADDPLEREADRAAEEALRADAAPAAGAGGAHPGAFQPTAAGSLPAGPHSAPPSFDALKGQGEPLAPSTRGFFERRYAHDFAGVRIHHGARAADSARSVGAHAYAYGRDIVFGAGRYSPGSHRTQQLLAHELAHVVQQGAAGVAAVQRSAESDALKATWKASPKVEALLARLGQADMQTPAAHQDADIDAELAALLKGRPDDLWVAQRTRQGKLGDTTGARSPKAKPQPVEAHFFQGTTDRRALVIAGVHGSEKQGIEVARRLIHDLQPPAPAPALTTIIVPALFPDNALLKGGPAREGSTPTNRNFPSPSEDLAGATARGGGKPIDQQSRAILPENLMLIELMERFHPERIISIHGTQAPGQAGVFYDRRVPNDAEDQRARALAQGLDGGDKLPPAVEERLYRAHLAAASVKADQTDRDLSLEAAGQIDTATTAIKGRDVRRMGREGEDAATQRKQTPARRLHPSIGGNVGPKGALDNASWTGGVPGGVSLGGYAPARGVSVFTVEPPVDAASSAYPNAKDEISGVTDKLTQADRVTELQSYADAVRTVLLGK
jgi:hypothetical protein